MFHVDVILFYNKYTKDMLAINILLFLYVCNNSREVKTRHDAFIIESCIVIIRDDNE